MIVSASYHTEKVIQEDPEVPWIMNVWLKSAASARITTQPALVVFINYIIYGNNNVRSLSVDHKLFYMHNLYYDAAAMLETHCTAYGVN